MATQIGADGLRHPIVDIDDFDDPAPYRRRAFTVIGTPTSGQVPTPIPSSRWYRWGTPTGGVALPSGLYVQDEEPTDPEIGEVWITYSTLETSVFTATGWVSLDQLPDGLYVQDDEPSAPETGDVWITVTDLEATEWDGDSWEALGALPAGIYVQDTEPVGAEGDVWIHETTKVVSLFLAAAWRELGVPPDGIYVQDAEPTSPAEDDTWITVTVPSTWRYLSGEWVELGPVLQGVYVQATQPAVGVLNDIWIDRTDEGAGALAPLVKRFNGTVWAPYFYSDIEVPPGEVEYITRTISDGPTGGLWLMADASGTTLAPWPGSIAAGSSYINGTGVTYREPGPKGADPGGMGFDGVSGAARIDPTANGLAFTDKCTVEMWCYLTQAYNNSSNRVIFNMGSSSGASSANNGNLLIIPNGASGLFEVYCYGSGGAEIVGVTRPALNGWFFISVTVDRTAAAGSQIDLRINDASAGLTTVSTNNLTGNFCPGNLDLMARGSGGGGGFGTIQFPAAGRLWGLVIYDRILNPASRTFHYNAATVA